MTDVIKIKNILVEEGALTAFIQYSLESEKDDEWADRPTVFSAHFDWELTNEGFRYWCNIHDKLQNNNLGFTRFDAKDLLRLIKIKGLK